MKKVNHSKHHKEQRCSYCYPNKNENTGVKYKYNRNCIICNPK